MNDTQIVVVTWNHQPFTRVCLESLLEYTDPKHKIVVIDNGSTDGTVDYLKALSLEGHIDIVLNEKNVGIAPAINQGIRYADGKDVCFVSNDCVVGHGWLDALKKGVYKDDRIGGGSPYISPEATYDEFANTDFRNSYRSNYWPMLKDDPPADKLMGMIHELHGGDWKEFTETWFETRADDPPLFEWFSMIMYIKSTTIDSVGLFDEQFVPSNWEDMDYVVRMNNAGLFRVGVTGSYCFHWSNISNRNEFKDNTPEYTAEMSENAIRFNKKWRIFLPPNEVVHGVPDGDKYPPKEVGELSPWPVSEEENSRKYDKWYTWDEWNDRQK